jgi:multidrug efflux pump subunit AcrB
VVLLATIGLSIWLFGVAPKGFFPQQDTGELAGGVQTDQSSSFAITRQRMRQFVDIVRHDPSVDTIVAFAGNNAAGGFLFTSLKPRGVRRGGSAAVVARLRPKLARVVGASLFLNPVQDVRVGGRSSNATYQYTLQAEDLGELRTWATKLADQMKLQPALVDINTDQEDHALDSFVTIDRDRAAQLGLTDTQIDNTLYDAFGQRQISVIYKDTNQYRVVMEADPSFTQDPTTLSRLYVSTGQAAGGVATPPLSSAANLASVAGATPSTTAAAAFAVLPATRAGVTAATLAAQSVRTTAAEQAAPSSFSTALSGRTGGGGVGRATATTATTAGASLAASSGKALAVGATAVGGPAAPPGRAASQGVAVSATPETLVPLSAFASWADGATPHAVNHQDASPATTISFNLAPGKSLSDATHAIAAASAQIHMPANVHGGYQGTAKVFQESTASEPLLIAAALVAIYLVLGILYESYIHPLTVLSTLPSAGVGALVASIVFHVELSIISLIGIILLIGIVKKNAILMIDFAIAARRRGLSAHDAIREAALTRFRPIMMTTFAAILGALPLAIGWGEGSELRRPLGVTIIGGLLVSQLITLLTTPVIYLYLDRLADRRRPRPIPAAPAYAT